MKSFALYSICLLLLISAAHAAVKLPKLVSNGMVLQRDQNIKIWGWAKSGEEIILTFKQKTYKTTADKNGHWTINILPQSAGGPFNMTINNIGLKDILIGDVWLCSGQSNMEAAMSRPNIKARYGEEIAKSTNPFIRQFVVKRNMAFNPIADVSTKNGWQSANPETVLSFSAVAYFFAKDLYEKYKIPIGIINSTFGGTPIQSWVNSESLKSFPAYNEVAQQLKDTAKVARILSDHQLKTNSWYSSITENDAGLNEKWLSKLYNEVSDWQEIPSLDLLKTKIVLPKYGVMWFKTKVIVPDSLANKAAELDLGVMQTTDETYINGVKIGTTNGSYTERNYTIKSGILKAGENTITIRLVSPTVGIGFTSQSNNQLKFKNTAIDINQPWKFKFGIEKELLPKGNGLSQHSPTAYYYAMIQPLANYKIKGIAWYQGESNTTNPEQYETLLASLIKNWRADWQNPELPFLYVQLANYAPTGVEPAVSNWALLREAQMKSLKIPFTAMAVTHDIGEKNDIHPANKEDVGKRLALAAEKIAYHENIIFSGPIYQGITISGNKIYVSFTQIGSGLKCSGSKLNTFSISENGKNFVPAQAEIKGEQVVLWNTSISKPIAVRYAWADSPDGANLYNNEGLPASSFKSN